MDSLLSFVPFSYSSWMFATVDAVLMFHSTAAVLNHTCPTANYIRTVGLFFSTARFQAIPDSKNGLVVMTKLMVKIPNLVL